MPVPLNGGSYSLLAKHFENANNTNNTQTKTNNYVRHQGLGNTTNNVSSSFMQRNKATIISGNHSSSNSNQYISRH